VPNLWDKTPEAPSPSELNPLTNPVLEQNLGRWAKVYFSNPPAKRDQAVSNLLEEIKRESSQGGRPYFPKDPKFQGPVCSACRHQNPFGHKFCSRCGQTLLPEQSAPEQSVSGRATPAENPAPPRIREVPSSEPANYAHDPRWMPDPVFSGIADSDVPPSHGWKYLAAAAVIVVAGFAYLQWTSGNAKTVSTAISPQLSAPTAPPPQEGFSPSAAKRPTNTIVPRPVAPNSDATQSAAVLEKSPAGSKNLEVQNPPAEARNRTLLPAGVQPAVQKSPLGGTTSSSQSAADLESGSSDLRLAQRYLGGSMGVRDSSEAAKLLWKAVSKQNATAAVLLSDLYLRGDGVPRSCDQARLLLVAAARRGSPLAAQQLRNFESQGCR
jgi:hypothetical protein